MAEKNLQFGCRLTTERLERLEQAKLTLGLPSEATAATVLDTLLSFALSQNSASTDQADNNRLQELDSLQSRYSDLEKQAGELLQLNDQLSTDNAELRQTVASLKERPTIPATSVIMHLDAFHHRLLMSVTRIDMYRQAAKKQNVPLLTIEREMSTVEVTGEHVTDMLFNRLWLDYQLNGLRDFDIPRLPRQKYFELKNKFETQNDE